MSISVCVRASWSFYMMNFEPTGLVHVFENYMFKIQLIYFNNSAFDRIKNMQ